MAAEQREARRKKILLNAELRMNRLLGKSPDLISKDVNFEDQSAPLPNKPQENTNAVMDSETHSSPYNLRSRHPRASTPNESVQRHSIITSTGSEDTHPVRESISQNLRDEVDPVIEKTAELLAGKKSDSEGVLPTKITEEIQDKDLYFKQLKSLNAQTFELLKLSVFVVLAFISRQLLKIGIGLFIFKSIFLPFIVLEAGIIYVSHVYLKHIPLKQSRGNLISAALMLCGLKQELMEWYHFLIANANAVLSDFCFYFFSFIVCYGLS